MKRLLIVLVLTMWSTAASASDNDKELRESARLGQFMKENPNFIPPHKRNGQRCHLCQTAIWPETLEEHKFGSQHTTRMHLMSLLFQGKRYSQKTPRQSH